MNEASRPILMVINGMGRGNSTRCLALAEGLARVGHSIEVATSGNGLAYFQPSPHLARRLYPLTGAGYKKSQRGIAPLSLLRAAARFFLAEVVNFFTLLNILRDSRPKLIIIDSVYSPVLFFSRWRRPVISLNNSDRVFAEGWRLWRLPVSLWAQFVLVETLDYLWQRMFATLVITPQLLPRAPAGKFRPVAPLVRQTFREVKPGRRQAGCNLLILYSGAALGPSLHSLAFPEDVSVTVIGRDGAGTARMRFILDCTDTAEFIRDADLVVANAGFSTLSELLILRKPVIVVPIPGHAEQYLNAQRVVALGFGLMSSAAELPSTIGEMRRHLDRFVQAYASLPVGQNGVAETVRIVEETLQGKGATAKPSIARSKPLRGAGRSR